MAWNDNDDVKDKVGPKHPPKFLPSMSWKHFRKIIAEWTLWSTYTAYQMAFCILTNCFQDNPKAQMYAESYPRENILEEDNRDVRLTNPPIVVKRAIFDILNYFDEKYQYGTTVDRFSAVLTFMGMERKSNEDLEIYMDKYFTSWRDTCRDCITDAIQTQRVPRLDEHGQVVNLPNGQPQIDEDDHFVVLLFIASCNLTHHQLVSLNTAGFDLDERPITLQYVFDLIKKVLCQNVNASPDSTTYYQEEDDWSYAYHSHNQNPYAFANNAHKCRKSQILAIGDEHRDENQDGDWNEGCDDYDHNADQNQDQDAHAQEQDQAQGECDQENLDGYGDDGYGPVSPQRTYSRPAGPRPPMRRQYKGRPWSANRPNLSPGRGNFSRGLQSQGRANFPPRNNGKGRQQHHHGDLPTRPPRNTWHNNPLKKNQFMLIAEDEQQKTGDVEQNDDDF